MFAKPLTSVFITSGWGSDRSYRGEGQTHKGVDCRASVGTPVYAIAPGQVIRTKTTEDADAGGLYVSIQHDDGWISRYMHLSEINVRTGQAVSQGEVIGLSGNTGGTVYGPTSTPHLHVDLQKDGAFTPAEPYIPADGYADVVIANAKRLGIALAGAAGGGLALLAIAGLLTLWWWKRR